MTTEHVRPLVAGNWKMNGTRDSLDELKQMAAGVIGPLSDKVDALICPPAHAPLRRHGARHRQPARNRRAGLPPEGVWRPYRRYLGRDDCRLLRHPCHRRPFRAPHRPCKETRCPGVGPRQSCGHRVLPGSSAIICIGETEAERKSGDDARRAEAAACRFCAG